MSRFEYLKDRGFREDGDMPNAVKYFNIEINEDDSVIILTRKNKKDTDIRKIYIYGTKGDLRIIRGRLTVHFYSDDKVMDCTFGDAPSGPIKDENDKYVIVDPINGKRINGNDDCLKILDTFFTNLENDD